MYNVKQGEFNSFHAGRKRNVMDKRNEVKSIRAAAGRRVYIIGAIIGAVLIGFIAFLSWPPLLGEVVAIPTITRKVTKTKMPTFDRTAYLLTRNAELRQITIARPPTYTQPPMMKAPNVQPLTNPTVQSPYVRPLYVPPAQPPPRVQPPLNIPQPPPILRH